MSEQNSVSVEATTVATVVESGTEQPSTPVDQVEQTTEQSSVPTVAECNATLAKFVKAATSQTEVCYLLGQTATEYVRQCLAASPEARRDTATERLATELWNHGEDSLAVPFAKCRSKYLDRVAVLIGVNAVAVCIGDGTGTSKGNGTAKGRGKGSKDGKLAWGTLREFRGLVCRLEGRDEQWAVIPHVEAESKALLAEVATSGLSRADVAIAVAKVAALSATRTAEVKLAAAKLAEQQEMQAAKLAVEAGKMRDAVQAKVDQAAVAVEAAKAAESNAVDEVSRKAARLETATAVGQVEASLAELTTAQAATITASEAAAKAAADKARLEAESQQAAKLQADADSKAAAKEKAKADAEAAKVKPQGTVTTPVVNPDGKTAVVTAAEGDAANDPRPEPKSGNVMQGLAKMAKAGSPKDVAKGIADAIRASDDPYALLCELATEMAGDDTVDAFLTGLELAKPGSLSPTFAKAVKGCRGALSVKRDTTPSSNGKVAVAV